MSFLPFVLSFLLILVLGSSVVFNSFRSTVLEKTVILGAHQAKLDLISEQSEIEFKRMAKAKIGPQKEPQIKEKAAKEGVYPDRRNQRNNLQTSKLNLWPLFHPKDMALSDTLYQSAIRLIQILYQDANFYKAAKDEGLAQKIVDEMMKKKGETFSELFPADEKLAAIYYKMLKGTNTGYPALEEYFRFEKTEKDPPVIWRYASAPVLRAILGEEAAARILALEKAHWEENHYRSTLPKEELSALLKNSHTLLEFNKMETVFSFDRKQKKGLPRSHVEKQSKVMATR